MTEISETYTVANIKAAFEDMAKRLSLIEDTCRDLIARIDRREYNYGPAYVRSDLDYLLACAAPDVEA